MSKSLREQFIRRIVDFKIEGFTTEQAEARALNEIAQTPEGEKVVSEAIKTIQPEPAVVKAKEEVAPEELKQGLALPYLDAQVRTITPPNKGQTDWTVEIGLQESLGESGGDIVTWTYTNKPTLAEIRADILKEYRETKANINKEAAMGIVAKS